jgi:Flp pilus assembly protein TadB
MELTVKQTAVVTGIFLVGILALWIKFKRSYLGRSERNRSLRDIGRYLEDSEQEEDTDLESDYPASEGKKKGKKNKEPSVEELLIMAGRISAIERDHFHRRKRLAPVVFGFAGLVIGLISGDINTALMTLTIGALAGLYLPMMVLRGWVKKQHAELSYYLPLLIEQISIGVSSSLDIGPCISQLVQMAEDRGCHNAATKLLKHALSYVKSGVNLEQALVEIGRASGQAEFKHALLALSQVAKFGGEVSKQLQELADAVTSQRESRIDADIRRMEVKASGPVAMIFIAYMLLLGLGIAGQVMTGMD